MAFLFRAAALAVNLLVDPEYFVTSEITGTAGASTGPTVYLTTVTTQFTTTTEFTTSTAFTTTTELATATEFITTETTTTQTTTATRVFETTLFVAPTAANAVPGQAGRQWSPLKEDATGCNWDLFRLAGSLLSTPLNITNGIWLGDWETTALQYTELQRLFDIHEEELITQRGALEVDQFKTALQNFVKEPLIYACDTLERLVTELVDIKHVNNGTRFQRLDLLNEVLVEADRDLLKYRVNRRSPALLLPLWALAAPEFRSNGCPNRDCFKVNGAGIEFTAIGLPFRLLHRVETLRGDADANLVWKLRLVAVRTTQGVLWWFSQSGLLFTRDLIGTGVALSLFLYLLHLLNTWYFRFELDQFGVARRQETGLR
ncbi:hypothetical protein ANO14919_070570 [Xylariales sp. No.14919]|nr:hypothetical protein F5X98DRAFT_339516 [Xylaria grammica]GAW17598.1 hypothetical protein ANO14919_070570 [Xylariales sp. No.14919]